MREPDVEGEAPVGRMSDLSAFEHPQRLPAVLRRLSEDEAPQEVGYLELRVEVRFHVQEHVETVVLRGGQLPVPGHLDRLEPNDVGHNVPEAERELRASG